MQLRGYFFEFLKASIADRITLFSSSLKNSEGGGEGDSGDSLDEQEASQWQSRIK
jgi:hypothetical protein